MKQSPVEEIANSITSAAGLIFAAIGLYALIAAVADKGMSVKLLSYLIYGITLVLLFAASTFYHSIRHPQLKHVLRVADHSCIFLFIAGTYTPFLLVNLSGSIGWSLFFGIWGCALLGIFLKVFFFHRFQVISTLCYLIMGWFAIVTLKPLMSTLPPGGVNMLLVGGILYTLGTFFYRWRALRFHHALWHLFVIAGSACHFFVVMSTATA